MNLRIKLGLTLATFTLIIVGAPTWAISLREGAIQDNLENFHPAFGVQQFDATGEVIQSPDPDSLGGEKGPGDSVQTRGRRVIRQATAKPPAVTTPAATTTVATTTTAKTNATTPAPPTTPPAPVPNVNVSSIYKQNYSFVEHTSFDQGPNGWTLVGVWAQMDLNKTAANLRPVPLPFKNGTIPTRRSKVEGGGSVGAAGSSGETGEKPEKEIQRQQRAAPKQPPKNVTVVAPDQNNFVVVNYVNGIVGQLRKTFYAFVKAEVIIRYFTVVPGTSFIVGIETSDQTTAVIYNSTADGKNATVKAWTTRRFNFTSQQTLNTNFTLTLTINPPKTGSPAAGSPLLAIQHIVVGGNFSAGVKPPVPPPFTNQTVTPPGSLTDLRKISNGIWTALYVFLAFFLLCIVAIVVLVVKGRNR